MASSFQKLTAEQVRARYREWFSRADIVKPIIVDALDETGLIHSRDVDAALKTSIPVWDSRPLLPPDPENGIGPNVLTHEIKLPHSQNWLRIGNPEEIPWIGELPDSEFPLSRSIPVDTFRGYEGLFQYRYRVKNWFDETHRESPPTPVLIDRTGPNSCIR
ncbi:hypothetical protein [Pseudomonas sp. G(2018)]|uniref:hypothetical protein n=1 Tax=Pseudomonas sp. G(2018) TaxID=2502242 RepID=UPI0010F457F5|nr:hypothetical protein [Pseudomonas sp. G(2018)]